MNEPVASPDAAVPWAREPLVLAAELGTDLDRGLTADEASARLAAVGPNRLDDAPPVPRWRRLLAQLASPLVYVLLAATAIALLTWGLDGAEGMPWDAVVITVILVVNALLGYLQEAKAEHAVAALQAMSAATAVVVRDGTPRSVAAAEVVPGDVLVLAEGDTVCADGRLLDAAALAVAEAALTGESQPVGKHVAALAVDAPLADRTNMVFSGTAVARGRGRAVVTSTGMATEMGGVARLLSSVEAEPTPLQREIARVGRWLAVAVVVVAVVVVGAILLTSDVDGAAEVVDVALVGVSLAVAAVPEGLPAVLSVVLAIGVQRMAARHAIVKELSSVETLGSTTAVCSDKTGTLTLNEMTLRTVVTASGVVDVTGTGHEPVGDVVEAGVPLGPGPLHDEVRAVLAGGSIANDATLRSGEAGWTATGDPTDVAFLVAAARAGVTARDAVARVDELPFSSERKLVSVVVRDGSAVLVTKGAPDVLLGRCTHEVAGTARRPLTDERRQAWHAAIERLAADAMRTIGVAHRRFDAEGPLAEADEQRLTFAGVAGIVDPPRPEARRSVEEAQQAGIRVLMVTGDHPLTARRIAAEVGIAGADGVALTGRDLDHLEGDALRDAVAGTAVFARVAPEHKLRIVEALQADGHVVAMTGDGVNDAPALKAADIGVAMGITGTDVSREAARMVLADDDFATIVAAVREGRAIFTNIRTFLRYLLSSNAGEVLTMFLAALGAGVIGLSGDGIAAPLLATQILWINLLTDTAPALALGVDPPPTDVMARRPRRRGARVIDRPMVVGIAVVGTVMALAALAAFDLTAPGGLVEGSGSLAEARTATFTTLVLAQLFNCFSARSDRASAFGSLFTNRWLWGAVALSALLQVAVVHLGSLNDAFGTEPLDAGRWLQCALLASSVLWAAELRKLVARRAR